MTDREAFEAWEFSVGTDFYSDPQRAAWAAWQAALASERAKQAAPEWVREPSMDRRIGRGDDFAGDAWRDTVTGAVRYVVVGCDPRTSESKVSPVCPPAVQAEPDNALDRYCHIELPGVRAALSQQAEPLSMSMFATKADYDAAVKQQAERNRCLSGEER